MNTKLSFLLFFFLSGLFLACNKDEEIIIENPETETLNYKVIEYMPAPGQFINENVSGFSNIFTMEEACRQAERRLEQSQYVSLGAWGGYIVIKFNKSIVNIGGYNFAIAGNNFDSSNEPGIVWVMQDKNGNGIPDETWYELQGSYYGKEGYEKDYWITYYKPQPKENTFWKDKNGEEGYINWIGTQHNQDFYFPNWVTTDSYTLHGSKLPLRTEQNPVSGIWNNLPFEWGYVDNSGEDASIMEINGQRILVNKFRLYDAVDQDGKSVALESIDFVKVQTAINGSAGVLGENSTEVCGFYPLY